MPPRDLMDTEDSRRGASHTAPADRLYLLLLQGNTSTLVPLPREGSVVIGRAVGADVLVEDASVSRQHAKVGVAEGEAFIADLGSHNGVRVNGERVQGTRPLDGGDVVTLGNVTLVFHRGERPLPERRALEAEGLRARLSEELDRVHSSGLAVSVLALEVESARVPQVELVRALHGALRLMDGVGQVGGTLMVLLPDLSGEEAEAAAAHLVSVLTPLAVRVRAGLASAPGDGMQVDALLGSAKAAALAAAPGETRVSGPSMYRLALGERSVVVADAALMRLFELLRRLAASPLPVLIHGETGAGKENAAWAVHHWSSRAAQPFVALNCAALPESLVEGELFGHERGAFSGADRARAGLLERASGGTLFLDEVAELSLPIQAKLLRALDQQVITRLGDSRERPVDLRVVAATHRVLADEVKAGRFRQDLFFRLSAAVVMLPPLRDRPRELPLLARAFLEDACARAGRAPLHLSAATMEVLGAHAWPGNVRELKNTVEYAVATSPGPVVEPSHLPESLRAGTVPEPEAPRVEGGTEAPRVFQNLAEELRTLERQRMVEALEVTGGVQTRAAQLIGMPLRTFAFKLKQHRIAPSRGRGVAGE
ncbi:sigma 54-interacting transcriptional regulator [Corallococcus carmarthensis]|uniref:sigma 54-interacting transcriptional regulator n=1 Tax=Corallococcus carmarthensis TaxID=2316728 RepID=UPI0026480371|nr:sigma 54-interacting transcriptional regulator [Corallococcus carmarthensis]